MYQLAIPIMLNFSGVRKEQYLTELARSGVDRVFLCISRSIESAESKKQQLEALRTLIPLMRSEGYEVGVWLSSLGHGGSFDRHPEYQRIVPANGKISTDSFCPLDDAYTDEFAEWVAAVAREGPSLIMLDDDYRLGYRSDFTGCFCPLHLAKVSTILGEKIDREMLAKKAMSGGPGKYRDAWMKVNGDSLLDLAKKLRRAVDSVDPTIRLGHCAVLDTWDIDGVDSIALARAFAGNTKPFLRLIGAAYWANGQSFGCDIANVIELERMQTTWGKEAGIEVFSEGDVFPRPRHAVPAAYLEGLDTALRADGRPDGILKYMIDYECTPFYETGYIDRHVRNAPLYKEISRLFGGKTPCGVRIYDCMHRLKDAVLPEPYVDDKYVGTDFVPASAKFLCDNSIPMQYTEPDVTVIFGENARHAPAEMLACGAILDAPAAHILTQRGFDVGLQSFGEAVSVRSVYFPEKDEECFFRMATPFNGKGFYRLEAKPSAETVSEYRGEKGSVFAYRYENKDGQRFLVYPFEAKVVRDIPMLFRNYYTQAQLVREFAHIRRKPLDAHLPGSPDVYLMTKKDATGMAVGVWNFFRDDIHTPTILLGEKWSSAEFVNCTGTLSDDRLVLSDLDPFGMAFILLKK